MREAGPFAHLNAAEFFLDRHVTEGRGHRTAFRLDGRTIRYAEVAESASRFGNALSGLGVERGDRVLLVLSDSPAFAAVFWGAVEIGAVAVPVNPYSSAADHEFLLNDSGAKVTVVDEPVAPAIASIRARCPLLGAVIVAGQPTSGMLALDDVMREASPALQPASTRADDIACWQYTSGSTGAPKAAVHSHRHLVAAAELVGLGVFGLREDDVVFSLSKMFFGFGLGNTLYFPARVGAASILVPERLEAGRALEIIARERPTVLCAVPTVYARMLSVPDVERRYDLSSLRLCVSSGEALPPAVFDAWTKRTGLELIDVVGSTEALHDFIANRPGRVRRGSCGELVPGFDARLVDEDGVDVATGTVGHLLIRGETTSPCYWNRPELTRRTMLGEWLRTGDMMSRDGDGYFYFAGRSDDMLKVAGMWVSPAEVEATLAEHPAVAEAAVVGGRNPDGFIEPHAFVVLAEPGPASETLNAELKQFVKSRLAGFKVPGVIDVVSELPKTATGKIQRFRLRAGR
jgi:benzoate-CoA ligase family protein